LRLSDSVSEKNQSRAREAEEVIQDLERQRDRLRAAIREARELLTNLDSVLDPARKRPEKQPFRAKPPEQG
jgi:hypothetical protein